MEKIFIYLHFIAALWVTSTVVSASTITKPTALHESIPLTGQLLYQADMHNKNSVEGWKMEGLGQLVFRDGWMEMYSPHPAGHHVFWCPQDIPDSFIARWEVQNLNTDSGLLIVFFAAKGENGEDIFDPSLPARDGTFTQYTEGKIKSYHISYYANVVHELGRIHVNLRKNNTFSLLQSGSEGIPTHSTNIHELKLIKQGAHIRLFIDDRKVIDYIDNQARVNGVDTGAALGRGKIGLRQMQWSHFRYRNFKVWKLVNTSVATPSIHVQIPFSYSVVGLDPMRAEGRQTNLPRERGWYLPIEQVRYACPLLSTV